MISRRGLLKGILAAAVAPAIVRADSLMRVRPWSENIILPPASGNFTLRRMADIEAQVLDFALTTIINV